MAMRPTHRSGGTTPSRPRIPAVVRPVYEDFRPTIEWQQDEESNSLLLIYLAGFQREHLKVSTEGRNVLRARGERLIAGNKWSRFQEDYPLPDDCNVRGIRAKFEGGILTITIPRKKEAKDASNEATKATVDTPKSSQNTEGDPFAQKQPSPSKAAPEETHQKAADDNSAPSGIPSVSALGKGRHEITQEASHDQKMSSEKPEKSLNEKPKEPKEESDYQKFPQKVEKLADQSGDAIKKTIEESKAQKDKGDSAYKDLKPLKAEKPEKSEEEGDYPKVAREMKNVPDQVPDIMRKTTGKSKERSGYQKSAREIEKLPGQVEDILRAKEVKPKLHKDKGEIEPKEKKTTTAVAASSSSLASYKQTVKKFLDMNEERQLLLNVGAAVLVLVAFGAYLSHTFQEKLPEI